MLFKEHLSRGTVGAVFITAAYGLAISGFKYPPQVDVEKLSTFFMCSLAGSLMIDLDSDSVPSRIVAIVLSIYCFASFFMHNYIPALPIAATFIFIKSFPHRNYIHSWFLPLGLFIYGVKSGNYEVIALSFGSIVHFRVDKIKLFKKSEWIKPNPWKIRL